MPDILLFGATGYTGRLTARALARRGSGFVVCGRDRGKLEALAAEVSAEDVRVASVSDVDGLARALDDVGVIVSCVGPFTELGDTAVQAALRAGVHYIDSTGEGRFIQRLLDRYSAAARDTGIALMPAMAFDEIPADVAATLATEDMDDAELWLTYAVSSRASGGTIRSTLEILPHRAPFMEDGHVVEVGLGERRRWAPMPSPLGPKPSVSAPLAETWLAPLHLGLRSFGVYVTVDPLQARLMRPVLPALKQAMKAPPVKAVVGRVAGRLSGPGASARAKKWTILAEAVAGDRWRNVAIQGADVYGLSAELLAAVGVKITRDGPTGTGVLSPVQAVGLEFLRSELTDHEVSVETFAPQERARS